MIDHVYTISERGCLKRDYKKNTNFDLRYDSHNFRVIKDSYRESYKFNLAGPLSCRITLLNPRHVNRNLTYPSR